MLSIPSKMYQRGTLNYIFLCLEYNNDIVYQQIALYLIHSIGVYQRHTVIFKILKFQVLATLSKSSQKIYLETKGLDGTCFE